MLQLVLQSNLVRHYALLTDAHLGVERDQVHLETMEHFPVVPLAELPSTKQETVDNLADALASGIDLTLANHINSFVSGIYNLSDVQQQAIHDTLATALPTSQATETAVRHTTPEERHRFAAVVEQSLREVLSASELTAHTKRRDDLRDDVWCFVQIDVVPLGGEARRAVELPTREFLRAADEGAASLVSLTVNKATKLVGILNHYRYWTPTYGRLLASSLLAGDQW